MVMVGWPDSGKTNYLAALWNDLRVGQGQISAPALPDEITYVEEALAFQSRGQFAPRSDKNIEESRRDFSVSVKLNNPPDSALLEIVVPDITGELWKTAVETTEIAPEWMEELNAAAGAILFVRVLSKENVSPLDWVTTDRLLMVTRFTAADEKRARSLPTQVALCELLRFLELTLPNRKGGRRPRVAIVVAAWDLLDASTAAKGPVAYLRHEYPMFAGRLDDVERLELAVFGVSALGGDFADPAFKERFLKGEESGFVTTGAGRDQRVEKDITAPIAWVIGSNRP
ncbi:hypothetical protein CWB41_04930 [Methylovirgula ligni]|nr:hypothetical protein CWB41_04930 [Methylovirgula ligni]